MNEATQDYKQGNGNGKTNSDTNNRSGSGTKWIRALYMLVFMFVFGIVQTIVNILAIVIFIIRLVGSGEMERAVAFGEVLGNYLQQIVRFLTFNDENLPWPFTEFDHDDRNNHTV